jgi:non-ribosomal peptide synthetase component F
MAVANRALPETEAMVGPLLNVVPVRVLVDEDRSFRAQLLEARGGLLDAMSNQHVPFDRTVEHLAAERIPGCAPLVQVIVNDISELASHDASLWRRRPFEYAESTHFDLVLELDQRPGGFLLAVSYATDIFDRQPSRISRRGWWPRCLPVALRRTHRCASVPRSPTRTPRSCTCCRTARQPPPLPA